MSIVVLESLTERERNVQSGRPINSRNKTYLDELRSYLAIHCLSCIVTIPSSIL